MTTPTVADITRAPRGRARVRPTCAGMLADDLRALLEETSGVRWPSDRYRNDPVRFAEEILGVTVWGRQREILEAARDHKRVSVRSGHKIGKSHTAAILALWFFCSFEDARVVFTSVTARQVDAILWREMAKMRARAGTCLPCRRSSAPSPCPHSSRIEGTMNSLARSGFRSRDFREIVGFTAREPEAVAGISGANVLYIADEASGIEDPIFEAIDGNRAGGGRLVMFSNPTRTEGEFFRSHGDKAERRNAGGDVVGFYRSIHVSSEETPNYVSGREIIPGLATREWVEEKRAEWGSESPLYKVRVRGEFVLNEDGKILSVHALTLAEERWEETPATGRLFIGMDPSGPGYAGDETAFALRRGAKVMSVYARQGLSEEAHVVELLGILKEARLARESALPVVLIDREGPIGSRIYGLLRAHVDLHPGSFELVGIRSSDRAVRKPEVYDRLRDELWGNLEAWVRAGGALPSDARLAKDLHAPSWEGQVTGKIKATPKSELRKLLDGRSPDRGDAVCLCVWEPRGLEDEPGTRAAPARVSAAQLDDELDADRVFDPYDADRVFDPYGGRGR